MAAPQTLHVQIADHIKTFRLRRELTLTELSSLTGIGKSTLSNLERGQGNPTIETIWRLAEVLEVGYGELVGLASPQSSTSAGVSVELLNREETDRKIETFLMKLDGAAERRADAHGAGIREHVLVVRGGLALTRGSERECLCAGQVTTFVADCEHHYAAGEQGAHAIVSIIYPTVGAAVAGGDATRLDASQTASANAVGGMG